MARGGVEEGADDVYWACLAAAAVLLLLGVALVLPLSLGSWARWLGVASLVALALVLLAGLIPLLLGLATASATLVASLGGQVPMRAKLALLVTLALLIAFLILFT